jgi:DNA-binding CsgD family transcriptional regulator
MTEIRRAEVRRRPNGGMSVVDMRRRPGIRADPGRPGGGKVESAVSDRLNRPPSALAVGITRAEEIVYLELCRLGRASTGELSDILGMEPAVVLQSLAGLRTRRLVRRPDSGGAPHWTAAAPDVAIERVLAEREREERLLHEGITRLLEGYHRERGQQDPRAADLVEVVTGRESIAEVWLSMLAGARESVAVLDKPPFVHLDESGPELEILGRGVSVRSVYERATLLLPDRLAQVRTLVEAGESAVMIAEVPFKLALVDRRWALLPVAPGAELNGALIVRPSPLLDSLIQTFESLWSRAMPVPGSQRRAAGQNCGAGRQEPGLPDPGGQAGSRDPACPDASGVPRGPDSGTGELLTLLTAGMTDDAIARRLGVSARTVQRRVSELMENLGARTRFQAGAQAVRRGLL